MDSLEDILVEALATFETGGRTALEQFLADHPEQAPRLRQALAELQALHVLEPAPEPSLPAELGDFKLLGELGAGGMGVVYLATQRSLGREVALKVVRPELLFFEGARERFRREIEAVAQLEHPAIVPILVHGHTGGVPYYAMPRIRGRGADAVVTAFAGRNSGALHGSELRQFLGAADPGGDHCGDDSDVFAGPWWRTIVRLVRQAALGIAHAHARGILHRDLKPSNVMFTPDGRAIVLDFGLAQARGNARLTRTGSQPGSPAYMAPEQVRGEPADERTDVYGLAATLHSLLGLRPPFAADSGEALSALILAGQRRDLHGRRLPPELLLVLDKALDVERLRRFAGAQAFADDLQAVLDGRQIQARRLPAVVRLRRFAGRHRALVTGLAALVLFVVTLPTALWWQAESANAALEQQIARADRGLAVSLDAVEDLLAIVGKGELLHLPGGQDVAAAQLHKACDLFARLEGDVNLFARVKGLHIDSLFGLGNVEASRGDLNAAVAAMEGIVDLCGPAPDKYFTRLWRTMAVSRLIGYRLDLDPRADLAAPAQEVLIALQQLAVESKRPEEVRQHLPDAHLHLSKIAAGRDDLAAEHRHLVDAIDAAEVAGDRLARAGMQLRLARLLRNQEQLTESRRLCEDSLAIATDPGMPERGWPSPSMVAAEAQFQLGVVVEAERDFEAAKTAYRAALDRFDGLLKVFPKDASMRSQRGACAHQLANLLVRDEDFRGARSLEERAVQDQLHVLQRSPDHAQANANLGEHRRTLCHCLRMLGDLTALETAARELGAMDGLAVWKVAAARSLLRCAGTAPAEHATALRDESLELLVSARAKGFKLSGTDPLYAPLRGDARFEALLPSGSGR